jgi:hypothetical protein
MKSAILSVIAMMALGVIGAQTISGALAPIEPEAAVQTISPMQMMEHARGLRLEAGNNAI